MIILRNVPNAIIGDTIKELVLFIKHPIRIYRSHYKEDTKPYFRKDLIHIEYVDMGDSRQNYTFTFANESDAESAFTWLENKLEQ